MAERVKGSTIGGNWASADFKEPGRWKGMEPAEAARAELGTLNVQPSCTMRIGCRGKDRGKREAEVAEGLELAKLGRAK